MPSLCKRRSKGGETTVETRWKISGKRKKPFRSLPPFLPQSTWIAVEVGVLLKNVKKNSNQSSHILHTLKNPGTGENTTFPRLFHEIHRPYCCYCPFIIFILIFIFSKPYFLLPAETRDFFSTDYSLYSLKNTVTLLMIFREFSARYCNYRKI